MTTNWIPGLVVLGLGLAAAVVLLLVTRKGKGGSLSGGASSGTEELTARVQSLLDQRRALEAERHTMDPARFSEEALRLEKAAAEALRQRDSGTARAAAAGVAAEPPERATPVRKAPESFSSRHPQLVGGLWGAAIVGFFVVLGVLLSQEEKPREEGGTMTGKTPPGGPAPAVAPAMPAADPQFNAMLERARSNPADVENVGFVTHELMRTGRMDEAGVLVERGLSVDPFNVELRVHRAVLASLRGEVAKSERELLHLIDTFPDAQEGLLFLAAMAMQTDRNEAALGHLERYAIEVPPSMVPRELVQTIQALRADLGR